MKGDMKRETTAVTLSNFSLYITQNYFQISSKTVPFFVHLYVHLHAMCHNFRRLPQAMSTHRGITVFRKYTLCYILL